MTKQKQEKKSEKKKQVGESKSVKAKETKKGRKKIDLKEELGSPSEDILAFIDELSKEKASYANIRSVRAHLKTFLAGEHAWDKFNLEKLRNFKQYLKEKVKPQTALGYLKALHLTFEEAARKRIISETPFDKIDREELKEDAVEDGTLRTYLPEKELRRLFETPADLPFKQIKQLFLFACYTGLKWTDLVNFRWTDLAEKKHKGKKIKGYMYATSYGKSVSKDFIPLFEEAIVILEERKAEAEGRDFEFVFEFLHEKDIDERSVNRRFNRILKKYMIASGVLQNINFHSARHTFAMTARERGLDPYLIAKLMGYKTLAMTSVYSKIHETEKIEALLSLQEKRK